MLNHMQRGYRTFKFYIFVGLIYEFFILQVDILSGLTGLVHLDVSDDTDTREPCDILSSGARFKISKLLRKYESLPNLYSMDISGLSALFRDLQAQNNYWPDYIQHWLYPTLAISIPTLTNPNLTKPNHDYIQYITLTNPYLTTSIPDYIQPWQYPILTIPNPNNNQPGLYPILISNPDYTHPWLYPNLTLTNPDYPTRSTSNLDNTQPWLYPTLTIPNPDYTQPCLYPTLFIPNPDCTQPWPYPNLITPIPNYILTWL